MRHAAFFALALALPVACVAVPEAARAADDAKAAEDYKALEDWLAGQKSRTPDEQKALRAEIQKRFRAFLKDHPAAGTPTLSIKATLADVLVLEKKLDEAAKLYDDLVSSGDKAFTARGRYGVVKALLGKKDLAGARTRLDAFAKERNPEDEHLAELEKLLAQLEAGRTLKVGAPPPPIATKTLAGSELSLAGLQGKVVLLDFWATWCPPCRQALPGLKKLYAELSAKGLEIVGIDFAEKDPKKLTDFLTREQIPWPQLVADAKAIARTYGVEALPRTVLIGKDGKVLALDLRGDDVGRAVRAALDGKPVSPPDAAEPAEKEPMPRDHPADEGDR